MAIKKGDEILHRGVRYTVTDVSKDAVRAEDLSRADARAKGKAKVAKLRARIVKERDDLSPKQVREIEAEIAAVSVPGPVRFGCRKALLTQSDDGPWVVPGQEEAR